jgi:antagonist of KipI
MNALQILKAGIFTTVQDLGRSTHRRFGVPVSGAMDRLALRVANLVVGNSEDAAGLECTLVGPEFSVSAETWVAVCGAEIPGVPSGRPIHLRAGETLSLTQLELGCRAYVAFAGGIATQPILGSRSTYVRGGFGGYEGRALRAGDQIPLGESTVTYRDAEHWSVAPEVLPLHPLPDVLRIVPGAQWEWFDAAVREALCSGKYRVLAQSDRMGVRLQGPALTLREPREMLSEPVVVGSLQVPPDGQPIVLAADCQTIGGYPKIAHVIAADLPVLAQLRPGQSTRFEICTSETAETLLLAQERGLARLREGLAAKRK